MKCPNEKVRLDVLPLFLQSNLMAFRFLFFRTDVAGFQILSQIFLFSLQFCTLNSFFWMVRQNELLLCFISVRKHCIFKQKSVQNLTNLSIGYFLFCYFLQKAYLLFALLNEFDIIQQSSRSHFQYFILMQNNFVESSNESSLVKSETKDKSL